MESVWEILQCCGIPEQIKIIIVNLCGNSGSTVYSQNRRTLKWLVLDCYWSSTWVPVST